MVKFIQTQDLLPIRNVVLRPGKLTLDECRFTTDDVDGAFHLGYYSGDKLVGVASFHPQNYGDYKGLGYQLRGMATLESYRGQGIGRQLLQSGMENLRDGGARYLWCNARTTALPFYLRLGFETISPEFEVKDIGPHYVLYVNIT